jgi:acid phosphatase type 7
LAANPAACTLVAWHHPLFSSGSIGSNATYSDFWQALHDYRADVVLVGHDHHYERFAPQNAAGVADPTGPREFVVGTGGKNWTSIAAIQANSEVRNSNTYGILKMTLHSNSYDWSFIPEPDPDPSQPPVYSTFSDSGSETCRLKSNTK